MTVVRTENVGLERIDAVRVRSNDITKNTTQTFSLSVWRTNEFRP